MSAFAQKIILTVLAVGIYALSAWPPMAAIALLLQPLAGLIIGAAWVTKPGDGALVAEAKQARRANSVPPVALVLCVLLLGGCAGTQPVIDHAANREASNRLQEHVNDIADELTMVHSVLPFVCAYLGPDSATCSTLSDTYRVLASALDTVQRGVDLIDAAGIGAAETEASVRTVAIEAEAFGAQVARLGREVEDVVAQQADRSGGGHGGPSAQQPAEAAPAPSEAPGATAAE